jgi:hypothetical protein
MGVDEDRSVANGWPAALPLANFAHALEPYLPSGRGEARNVGTAAVLGGIAESMFDNNR